jgi:hypothetical protein
MPLDQTTLENSIRTAFETAKNTPPPEDPAEADALQDQILATLAADLAEAIRLFVQSGDITGVTSNVVNNANVQIGTGTQNNTVHIT